jgi:hypothetical protein
MEKITYIYELSKGGVPFYIGKTTVIKQRKNIHENTYGKSIGFNIIDNTSGNKTQWKPLEIYWIEQYKQWGFNLANKNKGGSGSEGKLSQEEVKQRHKEILKKAYQKNKQQHKDKVKTWFEKNPGYKSLKAKQWREANPDYFKIRRSKK